MSRYTKYNSSYILRKKHQETNKGTIWYRDWVTTGGLDRFVPGKTPYYKDGNFVFTTSNIPDYQKKHKYGEWNGSYVYDDVKNAIAESNTVEINTKSNDLRDFAYFGSCVEMVRASIEGIINEFPAQITGSNILIQKEPDNEESSFTPIAGAYIINNPFNIDLHHKNIVINDDVNPLRYLSLSYESYTLNGSDITDYSIEYASDYDKAMLCPENYKTIVTIRINGSLTIRGIYIDGDIIFVSDSTNFTIQPKQGIIDDYFKGLKGFERQLLNRESKPLYKNSFITPIEGKKGVKYVLRDYTWPSNGYQIDILSPSYNAFVSSLASLAAMLDEYDCDNLYRNLTHEAIKNYDWTYTREFAEGEEQDNIDGGTRVEQLIRLYGRSLDDIKREIDGIKFVNNITYNGYNNQSEGLLSDRLELNGWDVYATTTGLDGNQKLEGDYANKWYSGYSTERVNTITMDNEFMRRMVLCSKRILSSKGTTESIDMIMGMFGFGSDNGDFTVEEEYRTLKPLSSNDVHDIITETNRNKEEVRLYDDDYSGLPLKDIQVTYKNNDNCITDLLTVPYYDKDKIYDGYLYFHQKGGWGSDGTSDKYIETFNYLRTVSTISELFDINPNELNDKDIYYVINISDIIDYDDTFTDLSQVAHTFYAKDRNNSSNYNGWENTSKASQDIRDKAKYLEEVVSLNEGNNPHCGYGSYDNGESYFEYMALPFKYSIDTNGLTVEDENNVKNIKFDIKKIVKNVSEYEKVKIISNKQLKDEYILNSKVITFTNKRTGSEEYKKYFNNVILKYLMQVIPSTTILILKGI
jgi:hypothetical protein